MYRTDLCNYCGKQATHYFRGQKRKHNKFFCSSSCAVKYRNAQAHQDTQQRIKQTIDKLYIEAGKIPSLRQIIACSGIGKTTIYEHGWNAQKIAAKCGGFVKPRKAPQKRDVLKVQQDVVNIILNSKVKPTVKSIAAQLGLDTAYLYRKTKIKQLYKLVDSQRYKKQQCNKLKKQLIQFIQYKGRYVYLQQILQQFNIDYRCTFQPLGISIQALNLQAGFQKLGQSKLQSWTYQMLTEVFLPSQIQRQKRYDDLRSQKGFKLRYDFAIPDYGILVQTDGIQHIDSNNKYFSEYRCDCDRRKDAYAAQHNMRLFRLPYVSTKQFKDQLLNLKLKLLEIVKPVELLEPLTEIAEGNQQPSQQN